MINPNIETIVSRAKNMIVPTNIHWDDNNPKDSLLRFFNDSWSSTILINSLLTNISTENASEIVKDLIGFIPQLKNDISFISQLVKHTENLIHLFPTYKDNKLIKLSMLTRFPERIVQYSSWHKVSKIKDCVAYNPVVYRYLNEDFKANPAIIKTALKNTVLYKQDDDDIKYGVFFDLPLDSQNNKKNILLALESYPAIYHLLDSEKKNDIDIIMAACKSIFYDIDGCYYSKATYVIPYIEDNFFKDSKNIMWVLNAFEDNIENIKQNIDITMSCFNTFLNKACVLNSQFYNFSQTNNLQNYFNDLLNDHKCKIYCDNLNPTGLEQDAITFFTKNFKGINKSFNNFILYQKLEHKIPNCKNEKKVTKI